MLVLRHSPLPKPIWIVKEFNLIINNDNLSGKTSLLNEYRMVSRITLDRIDIKIICALHRDGRMTKLQLSEEVGLSATPCWERMKKLEKNGIIKGYYAELDLKKITYISLSRVEITLKDHTLAKAAVFEKIINSMPEVTECEAVLGNIDYVLKVLSRHVEEYQTIIENLLERCLPIEIEYKTLPVSKIVKEINQSNMHEIITRYLNDD
jgi:Lrp/AsnC family transcriptional regulator of ectoine degradation